MASDTDCGELSMSAKARRYAAGASQPSVAECEEELVRSLQIFESVEPKGSRRFLAAALVAFAGKGYHATTTRHIATLAGASPGGLYTYYATKEDLLFEIALLGHQHILDETMAGLQSAHEPAGRIEEVTRRSVTYHAEQHVLARVVNADFRALDAPRLAKIMEIRNTISVLVREEVRKGAERGIFAVEHVDGAATAILRLMDVAPWYNDQGLMAPEQLAGVYVDLIMRLLGVNRTATRVGGELSATL